MGQVKETGTNRVNDATLKTVGFEQITITSVAKRLTATTFDGASEALIQVDSTGNGIRYLDDGDDPTATVGVELAAGRDMRYTAEMENLRMISVTGTAKVNVLYRVRP